MSLSEKFFEDEGILTLFSSNLGEVCLKVEEGFSEGYAAFTTKNARSIAEAIIAMADALDADQDTPTTGGLS